MSPVWAGLKSISSSGLCIPSHVATAVTPSSLVCSRRTVSGVSAMGDLFGHPTGQWQRGSPQTSGRLGNRECDERSAQTRRTHGTIARPCVTGSTRSNHAGKARELAHIGMPRRLRDLGAGPHASACLITTPTAPLGQATGISGPGPHPARPGPGQEPEHGESPAVWRAGCTCARGSRAL
jgi:hypothetical protein